jgi:hypothetical protein
MEQGSYIRAHGLAGTAPRGGVLAGGCERRAFPLLSRNAAHDPAPRFAEAYRPSPSRSGVDQAPAGSLRFAESGCGQHKLPAEAITIFLLLADTCVVLREGDIGDPVYRWGDPVYRWRANHRLAASLPNPDQPRNRPHLGLESGPRPFPRCPVSGLASRARDKRYNLTFNQITKNGRGPMHRTAMVNSFEK